MKTYLLKCLGILAAVSGAYYFVEPDYEIIPLVLVVLFTSAALTFTFHIAAKEKFLAGKKTKPPKAFHIEFLDNFLWGLVAFSVFLWIDLYA